MESCHSSAPAVPWPLRAFLACILLVSSANGASAQEYWSDLVAEVAGGGFEARALSRMGVLSCRFDLYGSFPGPLLYADVWLENPAGQQVQSTNGQTYSAHLYVALSYNIPDGTAGGEYKCRAQAYADSPLVANDQSTYTIVAPNSLSVVSSGYDWQYFNDYQRRRIYQVRDGGSDWRYQYGTVSESYSQWTENTCNRGSLLTGEAETNSDGRFQDLYYSVGVPTCNADPTCQSTATQTIWIGGHQVLQHQVTYQCSEVNMP